MAIRIEDVEAGTLDFSDVADIDIPRAPPPHPGMILQAEWMEPLGLSAAELAEHLAVEFGEIEALLNGERRVSPDLALRLARYFGVSAQFWMNLQSGFELEMARRRDGGRIVDRVRPRAA